MTCKKIYRCLACKIENIKRGERSNARPIKGSKTQTQKSRNSETLKRHIACSINLKMSL